MRSVMPGMLRLSSAVRIGPSHSQSLERAAGFLCHVHDREPKLIASLGGLDEAANDPAITVFHAGTAMRDSDFVTVGGRVLAVTAIADTLQSACDRAYTALDKIHFDGMYFRRDIAHRALKPSKEKEG